jgi:putative transposase
VEEGHLLSDHVHMLISIPAKYAVAQVIGFMKGKSAIHRNQEEEDKRLDSMNLWC